MGKHVCATPKMTVSCAALKRCQPHDASFVCTFGSQSRMTLWFFILVVTNDVSRMKYRPRKLDKLCRPWCCCATLRGNILALGLSSLANLGMRPPTPWPILQATQG